MAEVTIGKKEEIAMSMVKHYNHKKYWKVRERLLNNSYNKLWAYVMLLYIKRCDAFNGASMGTHIGFGAQFGSVPELPHGLSGIFISHNAKIGKNARIYYQVTIGEGNGGAPIIGDNCLIGAGAKIIGPIVVGDNVKIGANCIVCQDIPDGATVVMDKPRIIVRGKSNE